jgi:hypothetical protein
MNTLYIYVNISVLLRMRNVSGKSCRENQHTSYVQHIFFQKILPFMR